MQKDRRRLKTFTKAFYDFQDIRLRTVGRVNSAEEKTKDGKAKKSPAPYLSSDDRDRFAAWGGRIGDTEAEVLQVISDELKDDPVYVNFLKDVPGVGPTMAAVLLGGGFNIEIEDTPAKMWAYAGLTPTSRLKRGEKATYNPWMKTRMLGVLGGTCLLQQGARNTLKGCPGDRWELVDHPWMLPTEKKIKGETVTVPGARWVRSYGHIYFDYRHRKENQIGPCMVEKCKDGQLEGDVCWNCEGTGRAPWGRGPAHRNAAAIRYMVKQFLRDFWIVWRVEEGLPLRVPYHMEKLGEPMHTGRRFLPERYADAMDEVIRDWQARREVG